MNSSYCPRCRQITSHQRRLGFGTFFAVLITAGLWFLALPLYPKRCIVCGSGASGEPEPMPAAPLLPDDTKICPQCAETIKLAAKKCRFCGESFDPDQVEQDVAAHRTFIQSMITAGKQLCPGCGRWDVNPYAMLSDGGHGPWCPNCKRPVL